MRKFNLASTSASPEDDDPGTTINVPQARPSGGGGKARRLFVLVGALAVVGGGGYVALTQFTQFLAPAPPTPARPIRPIAKAPPPQPAVAPVTSPAPTKQAGGPAGQAAPSGALPGGVPPGKRAAAPTGAPPKTPEVSKATGQPPGARLATPTAVPAPTKAATKIPSAAKADPAKATKAIPKEPQVALAPPPSRPSQPTPLAGAETFSIQVGAMVNETNAINLKHRLEQLGYNTSIRKGRVNLRRHLVTMGDFADRAGADEAVKRLATQGVRARVIGSGGRFSLEAGSFTNEDDAIDLARQLQKLNFPPRIQDQTLDATVFQVRVGVFPTRAEAQAKAIELKGKGFPYLVVRN